MWVLIVCLFLITIGLLATIVFQHEKIVCLRYCYQLLAYFTPEGSRHAVLASNAKLMRKVGVRPIRGDAVESPPVAILPGK